MRLGGRRAEEEPAGDLRVGQPLRDEHEHLGLPRREVRPAGPRRGRAPGGGRSRRAAAGSRPARRPPRRRRRTGSRRAAPRRDVLEQEAARARRARRRRRSRPRRRSSARRRARPAIAGSVQICRVASMPSISGIRTSISRTSGQLAPGERDRLGAGRRLADDVHVVDETELRAQPVAHQGLVVGDAHPDGHRCRPSSGRRTARLGPASPHRSTDRPPACRRAPRRARACRRSRGPPATGAATGVTRRRRRRRRATGRRRSRRASTATVHGAAWRRALVSASWTTR